MKDKFTFDDDVNTNENSQERVINSTSKGEDGATYVVSASVPKKDGFKGFELGANYAVAKNIVAGLRYYDLEAREGNADDQTIWSEVVFTF